MTPTAAAKPRRRMSAEDRRAQVIAAAITVFAEHGYEGTSTDAIAEQAGVSQPYLFQLFGSKKDLFIASMREVFARTWRVFDSAAAEARTVDPSAENMLNAMGMAYCDLLSDRALLRCQLHAYAACSDNEIRAAVRREYSDLYWRIASITGADAETLDGWFARGMLMNTIAAIAPDLTDEGEDLTLRMLGPVEGQPPAPPRPKSLDS
jgi:AcrR family transcriptional regulator